MQNLILFINSFLSYLLVFFVAVALIIIASLLGIYLRKRSDKANAETEESVSQQ